MQNILSFLSGSLFAALLAATPKIEPPPQPEIHIVKTVQTYTCDSLPPQHSEAWQQPEMHELRRTCAATEQALLLVQQWEADPMAGIVYEPTGD